MINTITLNEAVLRSRFVADAGGRFAEFRADDVLRFDVALDAIVAVVNTVLDSGNLDTAGHLTVNGRSAAPFEKIAVHSIMDEQGAVDGYSFGYRLFGGRSLRLASKVADALYLRPHADGIEGCLDLASTVVALMNASIAEFNHFVEPVAA